jgi:hypothetical protein
MAESTKKPRNFSGFEDEILCRAYVSASTNPLVGTDQKLELFWKDIKKRFDELFLKEYVGEAGKKEDRTWQALHTRFTKKIQPEMNLWNPFYKRIAD